MSKRLQVIMDDEEFDEIRAVAERERMTLSEWVRQSLRAAREHAPMQTRKAKLEALERAAGFEFPSGNIEQMLQEIARGRGSESSE